MIEALLGGTGALYGWLLTYFLHSAVLLAVVWSVVRVGWVRRPGTQDVLWKVALLGSLITATAGTLRDAPGRSQQMKAVALHAVRAAPTSPAAPGAPAARVAPALRVPSAKGVVTWQGRAAGAEGPVRVKAKVTEPSETCRSALSSLPDDPEAWPGIVRAACPIGPSFLWQHGVVLFWLAGALVTFGVLVRRRRALRDALGPLAPPGPRSRAALERVMSGSTTPVRLVASARAATPCVVGGSVIVLPERCEEQLTDDELEAALAHELAHVTRRDVAWLAVLRVVEALFWLQPLNRVAVAGSVEATELECDDWAVARTGRPLGLARSLARVAEWSLRKGARRAGVAMARRGGHGLSERIRRILAPSRPQYRASSWGRVAAAVFVVAPAFLLPSVPGAPVVRTAILFQPEAVDGGTPTFMLLSATDEVAGLPDDAQEGTLRVEVGGTQEVGR